MRGKAFGGVGVVAPLASQPFLSSAKVREFGVFFQREELCLRGIENGVVFPALVSESGDVYPVCQVNVGDHGEVDPNYASGQAQAGPASFLPGVAWLQLPLLSLSYLVRPGSPPVPPKDLAGLTKVGSRAPA